MGLLRKQPRQDQASDWVQPSQVISQLGAAPGPPGTGGPPVPVRLRPLTAAGPGGDWMPGALHLSPGSIRWEPGPGVTGEPVELATAAIMLPQGIARGKQVMITDLQTPAGQFQLDMDPVLFQMSQELVAG
ncbi:MAG TPA: hypothetical protein VFW16_06220 [Streptosporangiaceae bacterium]|nr:hypothetical protein [Streptosporangiaceae bacterium]